MSLNSQIAMINIAICKQDGWSNPCENQVKQVYFFASYTIFFSNVIYSENVIDIDKFDNFRQSKNLRKLPSLVSFLFCVSMKRSWNFHFFSNSKMFTIFFPQKTSHGLQFIYEQFILEIFSSPRGIVSIPGDLCCGMYLTNAVWNVNTVHLIYGWKEALSKDENSQT